MLSQQEKTKWRERRRKSDKEIEEGSSLVCLSALSSKPIDAPDRIHGQNNHLLEGGARRCTAAITDSGHADKEKIERDVV
jgi:hypothetical protein